MKRGLFILSATSLTIAIFFSSCKKEAITKSSTTSTFSGTNSSSKKTLVEIQKLSQKYHSEKHYGVTLRSWRQYAAADAIGALDGVSTGSIAGLWGAVCGGVAYGAFASCALDMFGLVVPNPENPTLGGANPEIPETTIDANEPGNHHNAILGYVLANTSHFSSTAGKPDLITLRSYIINDVSSRYNFNIDTLTNIVSNCKPYDSIVYYAENDSIYFATLVQNDFTTVAETFFYTAFSISDNKSLQTYYNDFVDIIYNSSDFSDKEKAALITYSSITTASILYHNN